jgi:enoyl-CoA hydratase/carnithine racemase
VFPLLLERVTFKRARHLVLSSQKLTAKEARAFGLFDEVVPDGKLEKALTARLKRLLYASPEALAVAKTYSDLIKDQPIETAMQTAANQLADLLREKKNTDAIEAFMQGEKMPWAVRYKKERG